MPAQPLISAELFPPRNAEGEHRFWRSVGQLECIDPDFVSVTCGAFASSPASAIETSASLSRNTSLSVAAHLTLSAFPGDAWVDAVTAAHESGLRRLVVLRGDADSSEVGPDAVARAIAVARDVADFDIAVACYPETHPQASSPTSDLEALKAKRDAGATRALSQMVFSAESFLRFRDRAHSAGITMPLHCGVLPVLRFERVVRMAGLCGTSIPEAYHHAFEGTQGNHAVQRLIGIEFAQDILATLAAEGVDGIHLYALNEPGLVPELLDKATLSSEADTAVGCAA